MRLIDADKLEDVNFSECMDSMEIMTVIDAQPTAYNVEKVVEQLEELQEKSRELFDFGISCKTYGEAIEIVRSGGKE